MTAVSQEAIIESVRSVKEEKAKDLAQLMEDYRIRQLVRSKKSMSVVLFVGWGRAGKDESGKLFGECTKAKYGESTSWAMCPYLAAALHLPVQFAWENRHNDRMFWKAWCDAFRKEDPTIMSKMVLAHGDILVGTRGQIEFHETMKAKVVDHAVWVERPGVPPDPTVDFTKEEVLSYEGRASVLVNDGSIDDLRTKVRSLAKQLHMLKGEMYG
jgi:hypothetical protein